MNTEDLNKSEIRTDAYYVNRLPLGNHNCATDDGKTSVYFRDLESHLVRHISAASAVVGCVAWLTSPVILKALSAVPGGVSIVVQKEDFLRPDLNPRRNWKLALRKQYGALPEIDGGRQAFGGVAGELSTHIDPEIEPVRCVGNHNAESRPAFPRMHNKFAVFCEVDVFDDSERVNRLLPYAAWTGSFNFTKNAGASLENAIVMRDEKIVAAYFAEFGQILALSEPLDWKSSWMVPQWRIGS